MMPEAGGGSGGGSATGFCRSRSARYSGTRHETCATSASCSRETRRCGLAFAYTIVPSTVRWRPSTNPAATQPQEHFRINRGAPGRTIRALQPIPHKAEIDVAIDQPEQMRLGNLILQAEGVEEAFLSGLLPHHRERPPPFHDSRRRGERRVKSRFSTASFLSDPTWRA